jgi:hypothetical protein
MLLLEQADDLFGIAGSQVQIIVGELAPPLFDLAAHLCFRNSLSRRTPAWVIGFI